MPAKPPAGEEVTEEVLRELREKAREATQKNVYIEDVHPMIFHALLDHIEAQRAELELWKVSDKLFERLWIAVDHFVERSTAFSSSGVCVRDDDFEDLHNSFNEVRKAYAARPDPSLAGVPESQAHPGDDRCGRT